MSVTDKNYIEHVLGHVLSLQLVTEYEVKVAIKIHTLSEFFKLFKGQELFRSREVGSILPI